MIDLSETGEKEIAKHNKKTTTVLSLVERHAEHVFRHSVGGSNVGALEARVEGAAHDVDVGGTKVGRSGNPQIGQKAVHVAQDRVSGGRHAVHAQHGHRAHRVARHPGQRRPVRVVNLQTSVRNERTNKQTIKQSKQNKRTDEQMNKQNKTNNQNKTNEQTNKRTNERRTSMV
jgi:hypothetical protein